MTCRGRRSRLLPLGPKMQWAPRSPRLALLSPVGRVPTLAASSLLQQPPQAASGHLSAAEVAAASMLRMAALVWLMTSSSGHRARRRAPAVVLTIGEQGAERERPTAAEAAMGRRSEASSKFPRARPRRRSRVQPSAGAATASLPVAAPQSAARAGVPSYRLSSRPTGSWLGFSATTLMTSTVNCKAWRRRAALRSGRRPGNGPISTGSARSGSSFSSSSRPCSGSWAICRRSIAAFMPRASCCDATMPIMTRRLPFSRGYSTWARRMSSHCSSPLSTSSSRTRASPRTQGP
mmetsp:Transcript_70394/g.158217  ORF Transcript_70394/g.158217 Transcript_70394/m.158217 type:complete len:292 (-) Transcript_70394:127-1002(-)